MRPSTAVCLLACILRLSQPASPAAAQPPTAPKSPRLVLLSGEAVPFQSLEIDDAASLSGDGVPEGLTLDDLRRIELSPASPAAAANAMAVVELIGGGRVLAQGVTIADDKCRIAWAHGEPLEVPLDAVRAIRLEPQRQNAEFDKALEVPDPNSDRLFLKIDDEQLERVSGLVDGLSESALKLDIDGQVREIPRERVFGIVVAQPAVERGAPRYLVALGDGSSLGGDSLTLADGEVTLELGASVKATFPWKAVARAEVRSRRVAFLSDLKPVAEEQQALVTLPRPWQRDKSISGGPLTLGSRTFDKGIGVHARTSLTFEAGGEYDVLAATIGLDAAAGGKGDCEFVVLGDGEPLLTRRVRGTDPPQKIEIPISGRDQVTLVVEPGEGLDLADHGNWCDVRFIKNK